MIRHMGSCRIRDGFMAKGDLNRVPDGGVLRTLENGLHIVRRKKHEWSDSLKKLNPKKLKERTGKVWGSKFLDFWTLDSLVDRIEAAAILAGWTIDEQQPNPLDVVEEREIGVVNGKKCVQFGSCATADTFTHIPSRTAMSDGTNLPSIRVIDFMIPPLVDSIYFDEQRRGFAGHVSSVTRLRLRRNSIFVSETSPDYGRILRFWNRLRSWRAAAVGSRAIVHGGVLRLHVPFLDGSHRGLGDEPGFTGCRPRSAIVSSRSPTRRKLRFWIGLIRRSFRGARDGPQISLARCGKVGLCHPCGGAIFRRDLFVDFAPVDLEEIGASKPRRILRSDFDDPEVSRWSPTSMKMSSFFWRVRTSMAASFPWGVWITRERQ